MLCHTICTPKGRAAACSTRRKELPVSLFTRKEKAVHGFCAVISLWEASASVKVQRFVLCGRIALARWHGTPLTGNLSLFFPLQMKFVFYFQFVCHRFTFYCLLILTACALWRKELEHGAIFRGLLHILLPTRRNVFLWKVNQRAICFLIDIL